VGPRGRQIRFGVVIADSAVYSSSNQRCPSLTWHVGIGVGQLAYAYDAEITRYLVPGQEYITIRDPLEQPSLDHVTDKGLAFLFFPGNEQLPRVNPRALSEGNGRRGAQSNRAACVLYVRSEAGSNSE
jgi:hypothetical protein